MLPITAGRTSLLIKAGYRTLADVAEANATQIARQLKHLSHQSASKFICAAKLLLEEQIDALEDKAHFLKFV